MWCEVSKELFPAQPVRRGILGSAVTEWVMSIISIAKEPMDLRHLSAAAQCLSGEPRNC